MKNCNFEKNADFIESVKEIVICFLDQMISDNNYHYSYIPWSHSYMSFNNIALNITYPSVQ